MKLKPEIYNHVITDCEIDENDIFFWSDVKTLQRPVSEIAIIDHCKLEEYQANRIKNLCDGDTNSKVTIVYDHHVDMELYNN